MKEDSSLPQKNVGIRDARSKGTARFNAFAANKLINSMANRWLSPQTLKDQKFSIIFPHLLLCTLMQMFPSPFSGFGTAEIDTVRFSAHFVYYNDFFLIRQLQALFRDSARHNQRQAAPSKTIAFSTPQMYNVIIK